MSWSVTYSANTGKERKELFQSLIGAIHCVNNLQVRGIVEFKLRFSNKEIADMWFVEENEVIEVEEIDLLEEVA